MTPSAGIVPYVSPSHQGIRASRQARWPDTLHTSHLAESLRLSCLLIAACLAYTWIMYLGARCAQDGWVSVIHCGDRCDLSVFHLGLRLLEHLLNEDRAIPVAFCVSMET